MIHLGARRTRHEGGGRRAADGPHRAERSGFRSIATLSSSECDEELNSTGGIVSLRITLSPQDVEYLITEATENSVRREDSLLQRRRGEKRTFCRDCP